MDFHSNRQSHAVSKQEHQYKISHDAALQRIPHPLKIESTAGMPLSIATATNNCSQSTSTPISVSVHGSFPSSVSRIHNQGSRGYSSLSEANVSGFSISALQSTPSTVQSSPRRIENLANMTTHHWVPAQTNAPYYSLYQSPHRSMPPTPTTMMHSGSFSYQTVSPSGSHLQQHRYSSPSSEQGGECATSARSQILGHNQAPSQLTHAMISSGASYGSFGSASNMGMQPPLPPPVFAMAKPPTLHGTPASGSGSPLLPNPDLFMLGAASPRASLDDRDSMQLSPRSTADDNTNRRKGVRRGTLNSEAKQVLKAWMFSPEHFSHPYPTEEEKQQLAVQAGIDIKQVSNWFTNARKRLWQPVLKQRGVEVKNFLSTGRGGPKGPKQDLVSPLQLYSGAELESLLSPRGSIMSSHSPNSASAMSPPMTGFILPSPSHAANTGGIGVVPSPLHKPSTGISGPESIAASPSSAGASHKYASFATNTVPYSQLSMGNLLNAQQLHAPVSDSLHAQAENKLASNAIPPFYSLSSEGLGGGSASRRSPGGGLMTGLLPSPLGAQFMPPHITPRHRKRTIDQALDPEHNPSSPNQRRIKNEAAMVVSGKRVPPTGTFDEVDHSDVMRLSISSAASTASTGDTRVGAEHELSGSVTSQHPRLSSPAHRSAPSAGNNPTVRAGEDGGTFGMPMSLNYINTHKNSNASGSPRLPRLSPSSSSAGHLTLPPFPILPPLPSPASGGSSLSAGGRSGNNFPPITLPPPRVTQMPYLASGLIPANALPHSEGRSLPTDATHSSLPPNLKSSTPRASEPSESNAAGLSNEFHSTVQHNNGTRSAPPGKDPDMWAAESLLCLSSPKN